MGGVWTYLWAVTGVAVAAAGIGGRQAAADTLEWALVQAYQNNPSLNAQRAALRATDENVPQALSGYRPKLSVTANGGAEYQKSASQIPVAGALVNSTAAQTFYPRIGLLYLKKLS
jgi:outer membrane protein